MASGKFTSSSVTYRLASMSGGLNTTASGIAIGDNEATDLLNVDFDVFGSFKKRAGYDTLNATKINSGATCTGLHWFEKSDGTEKLFGVFGDKAYRMDDLDKTWDDITGAITVTAGNNNLVSSATFRDTALFTNNVDLPFQATESGNAVASTVPTGLTLAKFVSVWNNYAFYANVTVSAALQSSRFYWSDLKDITSWTATSYIDVSIQDGSGITGMAPLGDSLVIFKENTIYLVKFTGDSTIPFVIVETSSHVGAISGYSIQKINNGLVFLAQDGVYFFDGNTSTKLSDNIDNTIASFGKNRYQYARSAYQKAKNRYWLTFTTSGGATNNRVITWDSFGKGFSLYSGHAANALAIVNTGGTERIYFGDYGGFAYRADNGTDDNPLGVATAIACKYKTKFFAFEDLMLEKGVPHIVVYYRISDTTMQFGYSYDFEDANQVTESISLATSSTLWDTAIWDTDEWASSGGKGLRRDIDGRGRTVRFTFESNTLDETLQIDGMGFYKHSETVI